MQVVVHLEIGLGDEFSDGRALLLHVLVEHVELVGQLRPVVLQIALLAALTRGLLDLVQRALQTPRVRLHTTYQTLDLVVYHHQQLLRQQFHRLQLLHLRFELIE